MESGTRRKLKKRKRRSHTTSQQQHDLKQRKCWEPPANSSTHPSHSSLSSKFTSEKMDQAKKSSKCLLHEYAQKKSYKTLEYVLHEDGEGRQRKFTAQVWINGELFTGIPAKTKKQAEQNAAKKACNLLRIYSKYPKSEEELGQVVGEFFKYETEEKDEEFRRLGKENEEQETLIMTLKKELSERIIECKLYGDRIHNLEKDLKATENLLAERDTEVGLLKDRLDFLNDQIEKLFRRFKSPQ